MSYPTNQLAKYRTVGIATSSPAQVVVMLYDGIFRFLREAMAAFEAGERARAGVCIGRAQAIVRHLLGSMVPEANPLLHERLTSVYMFSLHHMTLASLKRDPAMLQTVIEVLLKLRRAWNVAATPGANPATSAAEPRRASAEG